MILIQYIRQILSPDEFRQLRWLSVALVLVGILEMVGISSIFPFMQVVAAPDAAMDNEILQQIMNVLGLEGRKALVLLTGGTAFALLTLANLAKLLITWKQQRYTWRVLQQLTERLLSHYLAQPYTYFLANHSSQLHAKIYQELFAFSSGVMGPLIELIAKSFLTIFIFALLIYVDPWLALITVTVLGLVYYIIFALRKKRLNELGQERMRLNFARYNHLHELLLGLKTFRVFGVQNALYERFRQASGSFFDIPPRIWFLSASPRLIIEIMMYGGIICMTIYLYMFSASVQAALPTLSLYALAGMRMLPAVQGVYAAAAKIKHNIPVCRKIIEDMSSPTPYEAYDRTHIQALKLDQEIRLDNIGYQYANAETPSVLSINLSIRKGQRVALVGTTGSGKTTLVDMIIGLLQPTQGQIAIDGIPLTPERIGAWQASIGYAPQEVMLFDDTIISNIAVGIPPEAVNWDRVEEVVHIAQIDELIHQRLPEGYQTKVGERGNRLSGGERQRIGLARALYGKPSILILDEATSAIDNMTEQKIITGLQNLPRELTVISIAHRLSTVKDADIIYLLEDGQIAASGTFATLQEQSQLFQQMAALR